MSATLQIPHCLHCVSVRTGLLRKHRGIIETAVNNPKCYNDYAGILHDLLYMSKVSYTPQGDDNHESKELTRLFTVIITGVGRRKYHRFKIVCGPGDLGEPVLTIMLPDED